MKNSLFIKKVALRYWIALFFFCCTFTSYAQVAVDADGNKLSVATYLEKAKEQEGFGNYRQASWYLNQAAMSRWEEKKYDDAINYFKESIVLNEKVNNEHGVVGIYSNLAMIYTDKEDHQQAYEYFEKTLQGRRKGSKDKVSIISALINTGISLNNLQQHNKAATYIEEALTLARELNDAQQMRSCYGMLSETYEKAGNNERSLHYFNLYRTFHEMVQRDREEVYKEKTRDAQLQAQILEAEKKAQEAELHYKQLEVERKQNELKDAQEALSNFDDTKKQLYKTLNKAQLLQKLHDTEKHERIERQEKHDLQIQQQRYIQYALLIGLLGIFAFAIVLYKNYKEKKASNIALEDKNQEIMAQREHIAEQKQELEIVFTEVMHKNERITQSINYAQRIQTAMMPTLSEINVILPNSTLFWNPRDIVSGDFYWIGQKNGFTIAVAADCTGHGVPGALVSMIGMNLLNQIVMQEGITTPHLILNKLDEGINRALSHGEKQTRDGMDIALVTIDKKAGKVHYSGAKNPLIYINSDGLQQLDADKKSVGGSLTEKQKEKEFTSQTIDLKNITQLYIYSDGYQDQFGGELGRKFMSRNFKNLLYENSQLVPNQRHSHLEKTFHQWKDDREQTDDVLVWGISIA